jgi:hypothetical protein
MPAVCADPCLRLHVTRALGAGPIIASLHCLTPVQTALLNPEFTLKKGFLQNHILL